MALVLALVLVAALLPMGVSARTLTTEEQKFFQDIRAGVQCADGMFYLPADIVTQGENWLAAREEAVTSEQLAQIQAYVDHAKATVVAIGTGDAHKWSKEARASILNDINLAAQVIGCSARGNAKGNIEILDAQGQVILENGTLVKTTGANVQTFVIASLCGLAMLSACVVVSKKAKLF